MARRRALVAVAAAGAAGLALVACDPVEGDMSTSAIAVTTDKTGTAELERQHLDVAWLNCTASFVNKGDGADDRTAKDEPREAEVDCQGKSKGDDGEQDITIKGRVTEVVNGRCVRGNLTARVEGKEWFRADVLGNCAGGGGNDGDHGNGDDGDHGNGDDGHDGDGDGGHDDPPVTHDPDPDPDPEEPAPTATVTVTERPDPTCDCYPGK
ncbi:hypothetical protein [Streptomyces longispororuber]|uniref:hypothetical protein n=1 Tax=Streptomyces longispororuber TaxID=68230 RepID=UPI00167CB8E2|nr:hypothetical protein [Streptomyces longispororuber]